MYLPSNTRGGIVRATILILMLLILPSSLLSYLSYSSEIDPTESLNAHYDSVIHEHEKILPI